MSSIKLLFFRIQCIRARQTPGKCILRTRPDAGQGHRNPSYNLQAPAPALHPETVLRNSSLKSKSCPPLESASMAKDPPLCPLCRPLQRLPVVAVQGPTAAPRDPTLHLAVAWA